MCVEGVGRWVCPSVCYARLSWPKIHFRRSHISSMPEEVICQSEDVGLYVSPPPLLFALIPPDSPAFCSLWTIHSLPFICLLFLSCPVPFLLSLILYFQISGPTFENSEPTWNCAIWGSSRNRVRVNMRACALQIIASVVLYGKLWEIGLALSSHCPLSQWGREILFF